MARELSLPVMGTTADIIVVGGPFRMAKAGAERLIDLQARWSRFEPSSELCQLNNRSGQFTVVSPETYQLIAEAVSGWWRTDGRYDPTVIGALQRAGYDRPFEELATLVELPQSASPQKVKPTPGCAEIALLAEAGAVFLPKRVGLDLGGIAKGFAADIVVKELIDAGARGACVNIGGDAAVAGEPPSAAGWIVEIAPASRATGAPRSVALERGAICTSTVTKRTWATNQGDKHHLIDPTNSTPASGDVASATVLAARAVDAEVATKDALLRHSDDAARTLESQGLAAVIVTTSGAVIDVGPIAQFAA